MFLGRKGPIDINRMWSMHELEKHIVGLFNIPIVAVKLAFYKCDIKRKLVKLNVNTVDELEQTIPPGALILLVPDQDLPIINIPNVSGYILFRLFKNNFKNCIIVHIFTISSIASILLIIFNFV